MPRPQKRYSQAERVLMIYDRLWRGAAVRAVELADELELSRRTCERDLAVIKSVLGSCLQEQRKLEHKVYKIPRQLDRAEVSRDQVLAYVCGMRVTEFLTGPTFRLDAEGLAELLRSSLPVKDRIPTARLLYKVHVTQRGNKRYAEQPDAQLRLGQIVEALLYERPVSLRYLSSRRAASGEAPVALNANPLTMVIHRGGVYFVVEVTDEGWRGDRRVLLALDRIEQVTLEPHGEMFEYPTDYSADTFLGDAFGIWSDAQSVEVTLRFKPSYAQFVRERTWHDDQQLTFHDDGSMDLTFPVSGFAEISDWILGMGANVRVIDPPELRQHVIDRLEATLNEYR